MAKLISIILAASLMITPAAAETKQCQKGDLVTTVVVTMVITGLTIKFLHWFGKGMQELGAKQERERLEKQQQEQACKI